MSKVREAIREAVEASGKTRYQLWKETGIDQAVLSRLVAGKGGMTLDNMERLAEALGLEIVVRKQRKGR
jgi:ribosome-binding protein aMBF1 (putative translation factor)